MIWPSSYAVVDIETTGLDKQYEHIIEIAIKVVLDNEPLDSDAYFVRCPSPIPRKITRITGITNDMLLDGLSPKEALISLEHTTKYLPVVGHNILQFDAPFINQMRQRANMHVPWREDIAFIDTAALYKGRAMGWTPQRFKHDELADWQAAVLAERRAGLKFSLAAACEEFGIVQVNAHRAAGDVEATHAVYLKLKEALT